MYCCYQPDCNIFANLSKEDQKKIRQVRIVSYSYQSPVLTIMSIEVDVSFSQILKSPLFVTIRFFKDLSKTEKGWNAVAFSSHNCDS